MSKFINKNSLRIAIVSLLMLFVASLCLSIKAEAASIKLNYKSFTIAVEEVRTLQLKNADGNIKWTSSDNEIATVKAGKVTGVKEGKATITATYNSKKYKCEVTVKKYRLDSKSSTIEVGKTQKVTVKGNTEGKNIKWKSSDEKILTVSSSGKVKAVSSGKATIYAYVNGVRYSKKFTAKGIMNVEKTSLTINGRYELRITTDPDLSFSLNSSVSDCSVVTANWGDWNEDGSAISLYIYPNAKGKAKITLTNNYNSEKIVINVTVKDAIAFCADEEVMPNMKGIKAGMTKNQVVKALGLGKYDYIYSSNTMAVLFDDYYDFYMFDDKTGKIEAYGVRFYKESPMTVNHARGCLVSSGLEFDESDLKLSSSGDLTMVYYYTLRGPGYKWHMVTITYNYDDESISVLYT